ncbi:DUF2333 family protein [Neptunicella sp. SCSIO 80796]|uniref:DUF2333 family protein n=1 Tax=Neptunicella plasticusilytica TaxID=3117012 RepID=UPI003A4DA807
MKQYLTSKWIIISLSVLVLLFYIIAVYWSFEPDQFDPRQTAYQQLPDSGTKPVPGFILTSTLIKVSETLLDKRGGYLSNDVLPPGVLMDNIPSWEFGALEMIRDLSLSMRRDFSRSQSQSRENAELVKAQPKFNIDHRGWLLPSAESQYQEGIDALIRYRQELLNTADNSAQFYTRADNLRDWLKQVEKRLGSLSQRLSASVGQESINTDLAGDNAAKQSSPSRDREYLKTSWWDLDNVFYESRGACWALLHFLKAVEVEFADALEKKNALVSLRQIIRDLEATQQTVWSPMILNGSGFGTMANHSLVMANYISRANAALIDLTELLMQG